MEEIDVFLIIFKGHLVFIFVIGVKKDIGFIKFLKMKNSDFITIGLCFGIICSVSNILSKDRVVFTSGVFIVKGVVTGVEVYMNVLEFRKIK